MKVIYGNPRSGKTSKLIEMVKADPNSILIVHDRRILEAFKGILPDNQIMMFDPGKLRGIDANLYIDNADLVLQMMTRQPIKCITVTNETDKNRSKPMDPYNSGKMSFSEAISVIKQGRSVTNERWNEHNMQLFALRPTHESNVTEPFVVLSTPDNKLVPWTPSQSDMFSDDWIEVQPW